MKYAHAWGRLSLFVYLIPIALIHFEVIHVNQIVFWLIPVPFMVLKAWFHFNTPPQQRNPQELFSMLIVLLMHVTVMQNAVFLR